MKGSTLVLAVAAVAAAVLVSSPDPAAAAKGPDGLPIFTRSKCSSCHSIKSQGVVSKRSEAAEPQNAARRKPPDLSNVGAEREAKWIAAYLTKQESIEGRKHMKLFRGTEAELATLSSWLGGLKAESAAPGKKTP